MFGLSALLRTPANVSSCRAHAPPTAQRSCVCLAGWLWKTGWQRWCGTSTPPGWGPGGGWCTAASLLAVTRRSCTPHAIVDLQSLLMARVWQSRTFRLRTIRLISTPPSHCRCLLLGEPLGGGAQAGSAMADRLLQLLEEGGQPASLQQAGILRHAAAVLARHASRAASSCEGGMSPSELRQAVHQLCSAAGLMCTQEQQHELEALLSAAAPLERAAATAVAAVADADMADASASTAAAPAKAGKGRRAGGKSVKFADDVEMEQQQQPEPPAPAARAAGRGRTPAASRGRRGAAAAAAAEQAAAGSSGGGDASPVATLGSLDSGAADEAPQTAAQIGLCQVFDSLNLEDAPTGNAAAAPGTVAKAAGTATARSGKHRSRLRMMQAGTPGPATARKSAAAAATAPRPARELPLMVAKTAPPAAARPGSGDADVAAAAEAAAPVLLVLDGALQALPWESAPGLLRQR